MSKRPFSTPEEGRDWISERVRVHASLFATDKQRNFALFLLARLSRGDNNQRHAILKYLFGKPSSKDLSDAQILTIIDWIDPSPNGDGYEPGEYVQKEWDAIVRQIYIEQGQMEMPL